MEVQLSCDASLDPLTKVFQLSLGGRRKHPSPVGSYTGIAGFASLRPVSPFASRHACFASSDETTRPSR